MVVRQPTIPQKKHLITPMTRKLNFVAGRSRVQNLLWLPRRGIHLADAGLTAVAFLKTLEDYSNLGGNAADQRRPFLANTRPQDCRKRKFEQSATASTGERLLTHKPRQDSRTSPGANMADICMSIREKLKS
jgi:hypothetical protein